MSAHILRAGQLQRQPSHRSVGTDAIPIRNARNIECDIRMKEFLKDRLRAPLKFFPYNPLIVYDLDNHAEHMYPDACGFAKNICQRTYITKNGNIIHPTTNEATKKDFNSQTFEKFPMSYRGNTPMLQTPSPRNHVAREIQRNRKYEIGTCVTEMDLLEENFDDLRTQNRHAEIDPQTGRQTEEFLRRYPTCPLEIRITFPNDFNEKGKTSNWEFGSSPLKREIRIFEQNDKSDNANKARDILRKIASHTEFTPTIYENEHFLRSPNPAFEKKIPRLVKKVQGPVETVLYSFPTYSPSHRDWYFPDVQLSQLKTGSYKRRLDFENKINENEKLKQVVLPSPMTGTVNDRVTTWVMLQKASTNAPAAVSFEKCYSKTSENQQKEIQATPAYESLPPKLADPRLRKRVTFGDYQARKLARPQASAANNSKQITKAPKPLSALKNVPTVDIPGSKPSPLSVVLDELMNGSPMDIN